MAGHGDGHPASQPGGSFPAQFPEKLEHDVAPEAEADQRHRAASGRAGDMGGRAVQIVTHAAVIEPQQPVRLAAAAPEIQSHRVPPAPVEGPCHPLHVPRLGRALQPVRDQRGPGPAHPGPVQIKKITVLELKPLAGIDQPVTRRRRAG